MALQFRIGWQCTAQECTALAMRFTLLPYTLTDSLKYNERNTTLEYTLPPRRTDRCVLQFPIVHSRQIRAIALGPLHKCTFSNYIEYGHRGFHI